MNIKHLSVLPAICMFATMSLSQHASADRCDPKILNRLPPAKRDVIAKKCAERAQKSAYKIDNKCCVKDEARPEDVYGGSDKDELLGMVKKAWMKKYPKDKLLGVHFHQKNWKRNKNKRWNDAVSKWQYTDVSVLPAKVVVKSDNKLATIFPAFVNKDNMDGSINIGVNTKKSNYVVKQMLVSNY